MSLTFYFTLTIPPSSSSSSSCRLSFCLHSPKRESISEGVCSFATKPSSGLHHRLYTWRCLSQTISMLLNSYSRLLNLLQRWILAPVETSESKPQAWAVISGPHFHLDTLDFDYWQWFRKIPFFVLLYLHACFPSCLLCIFRTFCPSFLSAT